MAVGALVGVIAVMVTLSAAVPPLRPDIKLSEDRENPHGITVRHTKILNRSHYTNSLNY